MKHTGDFETLLSKAVKYYFYNILNKEKEDTENKIDSNKKKKKDEK